MYMMKTFVFRRTVKDRQTGGELRLSDEQVAQINNMQRGRYPSIGYNPYEVRSCTGCPRRSP